MKQQQQPLPPIQSHSKKNSKEQKQFTVSDYFKYVEKNDIEKVRSVLKQHPQYVNLIHNKKLALGRIASQNRIEMLQILVKEFHADPNLFNKNGLTPLAEAISHGHFQATKILLSFKAKFNQACLKEKLTPIDFSILGGHYKITYLLAFEYHRLSQKCQTKPLKAYQVLNKKYHMRYVNFPLILEHLQLRTPPPLAPNFLQRPNQHMIDPVIDPRQSCWNCVKRVFFWKHAPRVEKHEVDPEILKQNRHFYRIKTAFLSTLKDIKTQPDDEQNSNMKSMQNQHQ